MLVYISDLASKLAWMLSRKQLKIFLIALLLLILSVGLLQQRIQMLLRKFDPLHFEAGKLLQLQKQYQLDTEHNLTQLSVHNHSQLEDTALKQLQTKQQNLLDIYSHNVLDSPRLSAMQQWPHGIRYTPGCDEKPISILETGTRISFSQSHVRDENKNRD